jgi:hypothetical protein
MNATTILTQGDCALETLFRTVMTLGVLRNIGLIQTEIQTRHRNFNYLPNISLLTEKVMIINPEATIVSAEVSLGYDVHHGIVENTSSAQPKGVVWKIPMSASRRWVTFR